MRILLIILLVLTLGGWSQPPSSLLDSLHNELLTKDLSDSQKVNVYLNLTYHERNNHSQANAYGQQALDLARKNRMKKEEAYALLYLGNNLCRLGNNLIGIEKIIQSAELFRKLQMFKEEAYALGSIANAFVSNDDLYNAIKYQRQGLARFSEFSDTLSMANTLVNIGETYRIFGMNDSAVFYFSEALRHVELIKQQGNEARRCRSMILGNMGMVYLEQQKYEEAEEALLQASSFFRQQDDSYRVSVYEAELGKLLIETGNTDEGIMIINQSLNTAMQLKLKEQVRDFSYELSEIYEEQGAYDTALTLYKQYKNYDDSLKNVENVRMMEQQQSRFELSKKEEQIEVLNRINKLQRVLAIVLFIGAIVFLIFIFSLAQANRRVKLINAQIYEQKALVEQRENEKALLLRELNHRVKNNLQMVASLLSLHARQLKDHPAAEALMAGKYRVEALTLIHQKLYRDDIDTMIDVKNYIEELTSNLVMHFGKDFKLELFLSPFVMKIDKAIPLGLIINELVTNSLKYGGVDNPSPVLQISILSKAENMVIGIKDNGVGLPADFDISQSKSFGLKLVQSLVRQLGGKISWTSEGGTRWQLVLNKEKIV